MLCRKEIALHEQGDIYINSAIRYTRFMFVSCCVKYKLFEHESKSSVERKKNEFQIEMKLRVLNLMNWGIH
jgi:hypothetical protein